MEIIEKTTATTAISARGRDRHGFSLVEVTIALGVVAFALISIAGLLPVGLTTMRQAKEQMVEAQIVQHLSAQYLSYHLADLPAVTQTSFDQDGRVVTPEDPWRRYVVTVRTLAPTYPGAPSDISGCLKRIVIEIVPSQPGGSSGPARIYTTQIAGSRS